MALRRHALLALSILLVLSGAWILNGACAFAMLQLPPPEEVSAYRTLFYQRAMLGIGCIVLGIVVLRWRKALTPPAR
ncbi:MAG: hypothetical protein ABW221_01415 [Vicinamibacteria bacterium]